MMSALRQKRAFPAVIVSSKTNAAMLNNTGGTTGTGRTRVYLSACGSDSMTALLADIQSASR